MVATNDRQIKTIEPSVYGFTVVSLFSIVLPNICPCSKTVAIIPKPVVFWGKYLDVVSSGA